MNLSALNIHFALFTGSVSIECDIHRLNWFLWENQREKEKVLFLNILHFNNTINHGNRRRQLPLNTKEVPVNL